MVFISDSESSSSGIFDFKVELWKNQLLDLGKRNRMINYRKSKRMTLQILEPEFSALFNRLSINEEKLTFQCPIDKDSDIRTFAILSLLETLSHSIPVYLGDIKAEGTILERQKTLKNLRTKSKLARDEQGTNILYLSFGFIEWRKSNVGDTSWLKSPVLMMPVTLLLESIQAPYTLSRYDDEIEVNPTLAHLFKQEYSIDLPTFELKDEFSIDQYMNEIEQIIDKRGWKLKREANLGLVSFLKISMYNDLNNNREKMLNSPVIRAITGEPGAVNYIPKEILDINSDQIPPRDCYQVVNADSSQQEAIQLSKNRISFVMQGPPGTGKSQTITNIIAEGLADGKKILFVSEKAAALEVVQKRLTEVKLDSFCLALHSHKANKKEILTSIGENLRLPYKKVKDGVMEELNELFHDREFLNQYANELHEVDETFDESLYSAFGKLLKLEAATIVPFDILNPLAVTVNTFRTMLYHVNNFEKAVKSMGCKLAENPWKNTSVMSMNQDFKAQLITDTQNLDTQLTCLDNNSSEFLSRYKFNIRATWNGVNQLIELLECIETTPRFPYKWSNAETRTHLKSIAEETSVISKEYNNGLGHVQKYYADTIFDIDLPDWIVKINMSVAEIRQIESYSTSSTNSLLSIAIDINRNTLTAINQVLEIISCYKTAKSIFGYDVEDNYANLLKFSQISNSLLSAPYIIQKWVEVDFYNLAIQEFEEAKLSHTIINQKSAELLNNWNPQVLLIRNENEILDRFIKEDYSNFKEKLFSYKYDVEKICGFSKTIIQNINNDNAIALLNNIKSINSEKQELVNSGELLCLHLKDEYFGVETNWGKLEASYRRLGKQIETVKSIINKIHSLKKPLLNDWSEVIFSLDHEAMLNRFKTEYISIMKHFRLSYRRDKKLIHYASKSGRRKIKDDDIKALLLKLEEIHEEKLQMEKNSQLIIKHMGDNYTGLNTDWNSLDMLYQEIGSQIEIVKHMANKIHDKVQSITREWHSEVLLLAPDDMLLRFHNKYCGDFVDLVSHYKNDIEFFTDMSKAADNVPVDDDSIILLLKEVKAINIEKQWFIYNDHSLSSYFGNYYTGLDTDWDALGKGLSYVETIQRLFPQGIIPSNVTEIICDKQLHTLKLTELEVIARTLSIDNLSEIKDRLKNLIFITNEPPGITFENGILPQLKTLSSVSAKIIESVNFINEHAICDIPFEDMIGLVNDAIEVKLNKTRLLDLSASCSELFGNRFIGIETEWDRIIDDLKKVSILFARENFETLVNDDIVSLFCDSEEAREEISKTKAELVCQCDAIGQKLSAFKKVFIEDENFDNISLTEVAERYDHCMSNFGLLDKWVDFIEAKAECDRIGLFGFTEIIAAKDGDISDISDAFRKGYYKQWIKETVNRKASIKQFRRRIHDEHLNRFSKLDTRQLSVAQTRIYEKIVSQFPKSDRVITANDEMSILKRELEKKRRIMPLRKLFRTIPHLLLTLKPCLMMSPLSVAYFLEAEAYQFDIVIFDEASQIFPQDAIGAIIRGKQVIIAGDEKQLPPTNFFSANTSNSDNDYDKPDDEDDYDDTMYDSILEETAHILPSRSLLWHYRSKHEHLIAFSNQEFYRNNLVTFPSSKEKESDTGVEFVYVADGYYEGGGKNYNVLEAKRCVELIIAHIKKRPNRSLGIIAFSEKQQQAILSELQRFREENPGFEEFFVEDKENEFFVKNLENVQGDERDTIIFSIGYAKTKEQRDRNGRMAMRFGPLGHNGGERRLNVAITRAKNNVKLVSSILPSDIDLSRTQSEGVRMLRSYIEFAMNGEVSLQKRQLKNDTNDDFVDVIGEYIERNGYSVERHVGCSEYKIDIAVKHPKHANCYVAGIECDGFSYVTAKTARDRDHLRKSVLESMGWNLYRVWSAEWVNNPEIEGEKLLIFIKDTIETQQNRTTPAVSSPPELIQNQDIVELIFEPQTPTELKSDPSNPYNFEYYEVARWSDTPNIQNYSSRERKIEIIKYIIGIEQPINIDLLYQRMAGAIEGRQKATKPVREAVDSLLRTLKARNEINKNGSFLTLADFEKVKARIPKQYDTPRSINYISLDEIGDAMMVIASRTIGLSSEGLIDETAKVFGYARKGENIMSRMKQALLKAIESGQAKLVDGKFIVNHVMAPAEIRQLCKECGTTLEKGDIFCGRCGNRIYI